jgi:hypothetical protein
LAEPRGGRRRFPRPTDRLEMMNPHFG